MITDQPLGGVSKAVSDGTGKLPRYEQPSFKFLKRTADIGLSAFGLIVLLPIYLGVATIILLADRGPIFYKQRRIGQHGQTFYMYKFRSMKKNAEAILADLLASDESLRKEFEESFKLKQDPRLIKYGAFLRATSLDELPQLINVLKGDMSLVGPRPIQETEVDKYGPDVNIYLRMKPGCAGLWQCSGRNDVSYKERVAINNRYYWHASFRYDLRILVATMWSMIKREGAY